MADDTPGRVAAALADVRMQAEDHHAVPGADALRLLKAVEDALKLADEWAQRLPGDPVSLPSLGVAIAIQQDCGAKFREAIGAALTGTQPSEDENRG